jgi:hypothetical protein
MNLSENMKALGYSEEEIKKVKDNPEYENFAKILDESNSFEEAVKKFEDMYQDFDAAKFREACESQAEQKDDVSDDSEEILDLEDEALEAVAGGSIGSFFKKNWKTITGAVVGGVAGAAVGWVLSLKQKTQSPTGAASPDSINSVSEDDKTNNGNVI